MTIQCERTCGISNDQVVCICSRLPNTIAPRKPIKSSRNCLQGMESEQRKKVLIMGEKFTECDGLGRECGAERWSRELMVWWWRSAKVVNETYDLWSDSAGRAWRMPSSGDVCLQQ